MKNSLSLWIIALIITGTSAMFQRMTGPSYPVSGTEMFHGIKIHYVFDRSHGGGTNHHVELKIADRSMRGILTWRRYKSLDPWSSVPMTYSGGLLSAELPSQPPSGKLLYRVILYAGSDTIALPPYDAVSIRYKGDLPPTLLGAHIVLMFLGMLTATRAGLEFFKKEPRLTMLTYWSLGFLVTGGLILGPLVQHYAFGAYWTGWPFGPDLTDDKTAAMVLVWLIAAIALKRSRKPVRWTLAAAIVTLLVYLIPHSLLGSELDYTTGVTQQTIKSP